MKAEEHLMRMTVNAFRPMADVKEKGTLVHAHTVSEENPVKREAPVQGGKYEAAS